MRAVYDYVLIDSRTGVSDTSGICTVEMPDTLVVCFTLNDQSIRGASAVAESVCGLRKPGKSAAPLQASNGFPFRVLPEFPTRVEIISEQEKLRVALDLAQKTFSPFVDHIPASTSKLGTVRDRRTFRSMPSRKYPRSLVTSRIQLHSLHTAIKQLTRAITDGEISDIRVSLSKRMPVKRRATRLSGGFYADRPTPRLVTLYAFSRSSRESVRRCSRAPRRSSPSCADR